MAYTESKEPVVDFSGEGIVRAEQTKPNSRAARRQAKREEERKWKIRYKE